MCTTKVGKAEISSISKEEVAFDLSLHPGIPLIRKDDPEKKPLTLDDLVLSLYKTITITSVFNQKPREIVIDHIFIKDI